MSTYSGERLGAHRSVHTRSLPLCPRLDLHWYHPTFSWGDRGAGSTQLALAILADRCAADENRALAHHELFRDLVIARLTSDRWTLTSEQIDAVLAAIEAADLVHA